MVSAADSLVPPWLRDALREALQRQRGHALLVHGAPGDGSWDFAMAIGQGWLCEAADAGRPCGHCVACNLYRSAVHPDQNWLVPEALALQRGLPVEIKDGRKPSRQIRIDAVREAIDALTSTSGRGKARVLVIFPGEAMNAFSASALLKTLEEPGSGTHIVIAAAEPARLLPTIRSRCQWLRLPGPQPSQAESWLAAHDVPAPRVLLAACGGRPLDALAMHQAGMTAEAWQALPGRVARGDAAALSGFGPPAMLDALAKLCHDAMACAVDGDPRFFARDGFPARLDLRRLTRWQRSLLEFQRHPDHPWNEPLLADALVADAFDALRPRSR